MLSVGNTLGTTGASPSLDTRVAVGAGVFVVSAVETGHPAAQAAIDAAPEPKLPAYNAHEFTYRSDFGKIILLQQNVETGQEVTQVPTEYHLRQYAASQREQRVQLQQKLYRSAAAEPEGQGQNPQNTQRTVVVAKTTAPSSAPTSSAPSAPAASQPAAPSVAPAGVAAAAPAHVDITA